MYHRHHRHDPRRRSGGGGGGGGGGRSDVMAAAFPAPAPAGPREKECEHKWCALTATRVCCACADSRTGPVTKYKDGVGDVPAARHEFYCPPCKASCEWGANMADAAVAAGVEVLGTMKRVTKHPKGCGHHCALTTPGCCVCSDTRPMSADGKYEAFVDGRGMVRGVPRWEHYCPVCCTREGTRAKLARSPPPRAVRGGGGGGGGGVTSAPVGPEPVEAATTFSLGSGASRTVTMRDVFAARVAASKEIQYLKSCGHRCVLSDARDCCACAVGMASADLPVAVGLALCMCCQPRVLHDWCCARRVIHDFEVAGLLPPSPAPAPSAPRAAASGGAGAGAAVVMPSAPAAAAATAACPVCHRHELHAVPGMPGVAACTACACVFPDGVLPGATLDALLPLPTAQTARFRDLLAPMSTFVEEPAAAAAVAGTRTRGTGAAAAAAAAVEVVAPAAAAAAAVAVTAPAAVAAAAAAAAATATVPPALPVAVAMTSTPKGASPVAVHATAAAATAASILDELNCPICMDTYRRPVSLPCGHSMCKGCAQALSCASSTRNTLVCPLCRAPASNISAIGVNAELEFVITMLTNARKATAAAAPAGCCAGCAAAVPAAAPVAAAAAAAVE